MSHVFDDSTDKKNWEKWVNYALVGLIILSTLQVFFSTYDDIELRFHTLSKWIDYITVAIFTVEVSLRIWCADLLDDKYKGF